MMAGKSNMEGAERFAVAKDAPEAAIRVLKSGAATALDANWAGAFAGDFANAVRSFQDSLRTSSVFFRLRADSALRPVPAFTRIGLSSLNATGWIMGQGKPVPITQLSLATQIMEPVTAAALIVATAELLQNTSAQGQALFNRELRAAVSAAVDNYFLNIIVDTNTEILTATGTDATAITNDLRSLLFSVNADGSGNQRLYFVLHPSAAKSAATMPLLFPSLGVNGGEMFGVPTLVSNTVNPDTIMLLDADGIAGDAGPITLKTSSEGDIEMAATPTNDASTGIGATTGSVSMFQTNCIGIMALARFAVERLRQDACAVLQGIQWGEEASA
jgi:hypothetical protein